VALSKEAEALYGKQGAKRIERKASKSAMPHKKGPDAEESRYDFLPGPEGVMVSAKKRAGVYTASVQ
jgi:hypothetical protein